ncbi:MAG: DUF488 domain-containing protein [Clostridiales bacterium]|nr:DUF488 domain-containing protein [Clostridiales bacterium]
MIYTSYFARLKDLPPWIVPVSICGKAPVWYQGAQYKKLAPKYDFFMEWKQTHDNDYYVRCFHDQVLAPLDLNTVITEIAHLARLEPQIAVDSQDKGIVLLCYERPEAFCHRHVVADWFTKAGIPVREFTFYKGENHEAY